MKLRLQRIVCWMLVLFLALGPTAYAETDNGTNSPTKITFPDTITHWSQKHVAKLASLGIVNGMGDGRYGVDHNISQQDVIVMAVRLMGLEDEAKALSGNAGTSLDVSDYARPHVLYALSEGILIPSEESASNGNVNWGSRSAKREWVAKVMVRALGKESEARSAANTPTSFNDNDDISPAVLGYVNTAVDLGIITGTNTNDFLPLKTITRSETASIFAKAEQFLEKSDSVVIGHVSSITDDSLTVRDEDGRIHQIDLDRNTAYYSHAQNYQVLKSEVKLSRQVYVVMNNQDTAVYLEVLEDEEPVERITGVLVSPVNISGQIITIESDGKEVSYLLESQVAVINSDGSGSSLSQLAPLSELELKKSTVSNRIVEILIKEEPISKISTGVIESIDASRLEVWDDESEQLEVYPLSDVLEVTYKGETIEADELDVNDEISYIVDYGNVTKIELIQPYIEPELGEFRSVDLDSRIIVIILGGGQPQAYYLADDVKVELPGMVAPSLSDLMPGDQISVEFDNANKVSSIKIESRSLGSLQMLTYIAYNEQSNDLFVFDGKQSDILKVTDNTVLEIGNSEYPVKDITTRLTANKTRIDLTVTGQYVRRIKVSNSYTGVIEEMNTATGAMKITNPQFGSTALTLSSNTRVRKFGESTSRISNAKVGDEVRVLLDEDQTSVSEIQVKSNVYYTVDSFLTNNRVNLRNLEGGLTRVTISESLPIILPSNSYGSLNDLTEGMQVTVSYYGNNHASVNVMDTKYGKVESVDRVNDVLKLQLNNQDILEVPLNDRFDMLSGTLSRIENGDRLAIVQDRDGYTFARTVSRQMKIFNRIESGDALSFSNNMGEVERFDLAPYMLVRSGNQEISLNNLNKDDRLYVYIVNGEIAEIEKI